MALWAFPFCVFDNISSAGAVPEDMGDMAALENIELPVIVQKWREVSALRTDPAVFIKDLPPERGVGPAGEADGFGFGVACDFCHAGPLMNERQYFALEPSSPNMAAAAE